jgi:DNA-binding NtrC family response regulator
MRADSSGCSVLVVSPYEDDRHALDQCLSDVEWTIRNESSFPGAARCLRDTRFHLVISETDLPAGTWKDVLAEIQRLSKPPFLIVTSRFADERLWAEALNLGAYDVLSKPFVNAEVARTLKMAWLHWKYQHEFAKRSQSRQASA